MTIADVSVIIPTFCSSLFLTRAVNSVINQLLHPREIIFIDDASSDNGLTIECINTLEQLILNSTSINVKKIFLKTNIGPGGARNAGWDQASSKYVAFLDSDDSWHTLKLQIQYKWMENNTGFFCSCHDSVIISESYNFPVNFNLQQFFSINRYKLLLMNVIPTRSVLILNTNTFRFPQHMRFAEDYYLWLTIVFNDFKFAYLPIPLAHSYKKNFGDSGLTQNTLSMHLGSIKCFHDLYINKHINYLTYIFFLYIEKIKYLKRILIIYIDKLLT